MVNGGAQGAKGKKMEGRREEGWLVWWVSVNLVPGWILNLIFGQSELEFGIAFSDWF